MLIEKNSITGIIKPYPANLKEVEGTHQTVMEFQTALSGFHSAELSPIITSNGPNCEPPSKISIVGRNRDKIL